MATKTTTTKLAAAPAPTKPIAIDDSGKYQVEFWGTEKDDTIYGNDHDNRLYGSGGKDTLIGGAGADQLHGGNGEDTASYKTSKSYVSVDLAAGGDHGKGYAGDAKGDTLYSIENVTARITTTPSRATISPTCSTAAAATTRSMAAAETIR